MEYLLEKHQGCSTEFQEALLEWRNAPWSGDHFSPAQLMIGHRQCTAQPAHPTAYKHICTAPKESLHQPADTGFTRQFSPGDKVFLQNPHTKQWDKQGRIISQRENRRSYYMEEDNGGRYLRNRKLLRPVPSSNPHTAKA